MFTCSQHWEHTGEVYPVSTCLTSRWAYIVWYVIMLSMYPMLRFATHDKPRLQGGNETLVKLTIIVTGNIDLLDYVMSISIFFGNILSHMWMFTSFLFFLMVFALYADNWVTCFKLEFSRKALWRVRVLVNDQGQFYGLRAQGCMGPTFFMLVVPPTVGGSLFMYVCWLRWWNSEGTYCYQ